MNLAPPRLPTREFRSPRCRERPRLGMAKVVVRIAGTLFAAMLLIPSAMVAWAGPVPDTGRACYDANDNETECPQPGEDGYGQDGNYRINPPSFTKLDAEGGELPADAAAWAMVRDNVTGLTWEVKTDKDGVADYTNPHDADNTYTWYDPNPTTNGGHPGTPGDGTDSADLIEALNAAGFGGYCDWRLPTCQELHRIVDYGPSDPPAIDAGFFANMQTSCYWSATSRAGAADQFAWKIDFSVWQRHQFGIKSDSQGATPDRDYVLAVRGDASTAADRFVDNCDGTVTDVTTGLMWQQGTASVRLTLSQALSYCETLALAGYTDWRLPNIKELDSIIDRSRANPSIDTDFFPDSASYLYAFWSSTLAWGANFAEGECLRPTFPRWYPRVLSVRAVRGGQNRTAGNPVISRPMPGSMFAGGDTLAIGWETAGLAGDVRISISSGGGREGSFVPIVESTANDGRYDWPIDDRLFSYNCVLKLEPLGAPEKVATQGLFGITQEPAVTGVAIEGPGSVQEDDTGAYSLVVRYTDGTSRTVTGEAIWSLVSPYASIGQDGVLAASPVSTDRTVTISASYGGRCTTHAVTVQNRRACDLSCGLWARAVLDVPGEAVELVWKMVGADITPSGDQVISGYFYADPVEFVHGSACNPEIFVKIYIAANGWCNMAFSHVTVDDVAVYSAHHHTGSADQVGTLARSRRLVEHRYDAVRIDDPLSPSEPGTMVAQSAVDGGYELAGSLWAKAVLHASESPVTLSWKQLGTQQTPGGDRVVSGYFYADPADFAYGSACNPEVFVKLYIAANGWANLAFNHVTVDPVTVSSAHRYGGAAQQSGRATLSNRLVEQTYTGVSVAPDPIFTNSLGMTFNRIPAGTFTMGSPADEPGRDESEIQHEVTLTQPFYMQATEVTQRQWRAVMGSDPSAFQSCGDDCPVENVSWDHVQVFIAALNRLGEGTYRLPSEAEWEYAARAGSTTAFANGEITVTDGGGDPNLDVMGWYFHNSGGTPHPVAGKQPNAWGLYDMHGNVAEWCQDWIWAYPWEPVTDPTGPSSGSLRVTRGGHWIHYARYCRSAVRVGAYPFSPGDAVGFRLVALPNG